MLSYLDTIADYLKLKDLDIISIEKIGQTEHSLIFSYTYRIVKTKTKPDDEYGTLLLRERYYETKVNSALLNKKDRTIEEIT